MARLLGPDAGSRLAYLEDGSPAANATAVVYANEGATVLADIRDYDGSETPGGVALGSQVTTDAHGQLERFWFPEGVDRLWVKVGADGPVWPIDADNNRRLDLTRQVFMAAAYGAKGDGATDDTAAIQAAVNAAAAVGGGEVRLGRGTYLVGGTITLPIDTPIALRGEGIEHIGGAKGTTLKRGFGSTAPVISGVGVGNAGNQRIHVEITDMSINGGGLAGTVVKLEQVNTSLIRNVRISDAPATLLRAVQWWNSWLDKVVFNDGGSGTASPACQLVADNNTVRLTDCEWEANGGTDLHVEGIAVLVSSPKLERDSGNFPLVNLLNAGTVQITGGFLHLGPGATGTHVVQSGTVVPSRPNGIVNCQLSGSRESAGVEADFAVVPYFVDVQAGDMLLSNVSMNGDPTSAFVHAASGLGVNSLRLRNVAVNRPAKLLLDDRVGSVYGLGSIPLVPAILNAAVSGGGTAVILESSVNRPIWRHPDGSTSNVLYGTVPIPPDAANNRPVRIRLLWYCDVAVGAIRYLVGVRALSPSGDDITVGQTDFPATVTVPATANRTTTTTVTTTVNVVPGARWVAVLLQRLGGDAADTCTGSMRVLGVELLYERAV
ncbi:glycosyl hydrolase family 28-related protein [Micromonospora sp. URMC 103]|uniref:glycosyl hydrolase family 28-related protein n=1 Tax=Micromonospora sp. URMC 103 TaxID=3423406 RepID=UPI003F1A9789